MKNLQEDFQKTISALEEKRDLVKEAFLQRRQLKKYKRGILEMVFTTRIRWFLSAPFIYSMIIPIVIFHIFLEIYHQITFRLCHIPLVSYKDHFVFDRRHLDYLNVLEKFNCIYCGYYNGLIGYAREIGGHKRYWVPHQTRTQNFLTSIHSTRIFMNISMQKAAKKERIELRKTGKLSYSDINPPA
jgi:hypothetical protein